jgi:hypothetical protein
MAQTPSNMLPLDTIAPDFNLKDTKLPILKLLMIAKAKKERLFYSFAIIVRLCIM